ncbi:HDOD domain-containing protein [Sulfurimonas sp.]|uniref:HDOD domain-containing protein n=1 Tax=Sulfurimonas sp. TaxID=2022749 RepID=UPI002B45B11B|nr:HDOD domain-containing protein [Sulfurimonas sp.]
MITQEQIDSYIDKIPPSPKVLRDTLTFLNNGELAKASKMAQSDHALACYLRDLVNKPIYGFANKVNNVSQIFGILGLSGAQQSVYNYMTTLLSPAKWILFKLNTRVFHELQARLSINWEIILKHLKIEDKNISASISLLPASIIITEALFCEKIQDVTILRSAKNLDYNTILTRLSGIGIFDICEQISKKWEMPQEIAEIIQASSGINPSQNEELNKLGKWMHLLLFYELSKPIFIEAGLNDFINFQVDYIDDIYEDFAALMEVS